VAGDTLVRDDGTRFAVLVSHADQLLTLKPVLADGGRLTTLDDEEADAVSTEPFGVAVLKIV
jgi:hypothetical protein